MKSQTTRFIVRRLAQSALIVFIVVIMNFLILHAVPGDIVDVIAGQAGTMDAELAASLRARFGLDQPIPVQLFQYLINVLQGDLGYSFRQSAAVSVLIAERLPATAILVVLSVIVSVVVGAVVGTIAARNAHGPIDVVISVAILLCYAVPVFLVGIALVLVFSVELKWLPITGLSTPGVELTWFGYILDVAKHLVLPVTSLSLFYVAIYARLARASLLEVLELDYVRTARAKGLSEVRVVYLHALRNALMPLTTMAGLQVSALFGGAVLVETIFGLPGLGRLAFDAVFQRDYPLLLGVLLTSSFVVVAVNLVVDVLYTVVDPRVELS